MADPAPSPAYLQALRDLPNVDILLALAGLAQGGSLDDALEKDVSNIREFLRERMVVTLAQENAAKRRIAATFLQAEDTWLQTRGRKIKTCHTAHMVASRQVPDSGLQVLILPHACNSPACPTCCRLKSAKYFLRAYKQLSRNLDSIDHLSHLVCTVRNPPWGSLADTLERLLTTWQRLQHSVGWREHVRGFVWGLEITLNRRSKSWHPHIHTILDAKYWPKDQVKATWRRLAGRNRLLGNTHIKSAITPGLPLAQAVHECTKYICKPFEDLGVPAPCLYELAKALHHTRRKGSGGTLRIPTAEKHDIPFRFDGGLKKVLLALVDGKNTTHAAAVLRAIWSDKTTLLEVATSYPAWLWAHAPARTTQKGKKE